MQKVVGIFKIIFVKEDAEFCATGIEGKGFVIWRIVRGELYKKGS